MRFNHIIMEHIFYSYYIDFLLKGKLKAVQISLAVTFTLLVVIVNAGGFFNYIIGKSDAVIDLLFLVLFIYSLMNFGYAVFNRYSPSPDLVETEKIKNNLVSQKNESETETGKNTKYSILQHKSYGTGIKSSPKVPKIVNHKTPIKLKPTKKETSAPPVEINIKSTEDFFEDEKEEWSDKYSGVINDNQELDITDVPHENDETPDSIRKNNFH